MSITFIAKEEFFTFHDPMLDGKLIDRKTEIRMDPLTGETSRIIFDPGAPFTSTDYSEQAKQTEGTKCPFCPENVHTFTPKFPNDLIENGRIIQGEAVVFPNLFPYSKHNAVVSMCDQHYVKLDEFTAPMIANSFSAAHNYLTKVITQDRETAYASINWNYLPPSGGSILHPHIHVLASEMPTNYQLIALASSEQFHTETDNNYYDSLIETERKIDERFIATVGSIDWVHAFAPKSHTDFIGVLDVSSLDELNDNNWQDLAESLTHFFRYFESIGIASFNLGLFIPVSKNSSERVHVRIVPRLTMGTLQTSDMNVFNFLHGEPLCLKVPEEITKEVAVYFSK
ncbi:hypothetical protein I2483_00280 [Sporosarcina sp. E16_3]|uniref:hypothetical protein n=1 Tax=Sporosarcina sp. E16_3 TaxID=2789293 RepID=UPI001A91A8C5|nr:hypothetical protein [Sporosarcina sp. E16_3]MBO0600088.1 hypothetical protein [Sporosarcina sp. E16_3]